MRDPHDGLGFRIGERLDQHSVHDAENCRRRADSERERQNRSDAEGWIQAQHSCRVTDLLQHAFHKRSGVHFINLFADSREIAKLAPCRPPRLIHFHAMGDVLLGGYLDVGFEFFLLLGIGLRPTPKSPHAHDLFHFQHF